MGSARRFCPRESGRALSHWSLPEPSRQHLPNGQRFVDCALPAYKIAIEYDGRHHLTDEQQHSDQLRDESLRRLQTGAIKLNLCQSPSRNPRVKPARLLSK